MEGGIGTYLISWDMLILASSLKLSHTNFDNSSWSTSREILQILKVELIQQWSTNSTSMRLKEFISLKSKRSKRT